MRAGVSVRVRLRFRQRARVNAAVPRALGLTNLLTHSLTSLLAHHAEARHRVHLEQGGPPPGHGRRAL